ncbi:MULTISPECIES: DNA polymerase III subunit gamma/tau [unclassified Lentimonas]|uniref:DNA polymerase III subunit gamma/tau n=1 Tax=unclassified Lentimonas TaxID=2630993 RepID=UPI00132ADCA6|nr:MULTISPECIES: DNA polymerase III subunit gamma/tau [unclassified Lentimonas]CAA6679057.1 DNA polymerase III delta prime subunit (EC [Lentimonas sp. CC4]CAA6684203.1 DNA polymerase III delta prime subunit (EC [Lentimonas sp. CC6]CAA6693695.1 DNA polymerase III delta prime subunit (EC [Lentimonas sp. CC10]CAA6696109.1 DNA polymerase III delta prime subunit (EC [Lentimonas sp. CC19]CAA7071674.1 DNA polymerase III delta prime subunit (EC [Lentimonas sp. CC11]
MQLSQALPEALRDSRAVEVLERSLAQNRLGHGILLHGESPDYLEEIVRAIASTLLETDRDPFEHPDCFMLRPQGKARMIKIGSDSDRVGGDWPKNSMRRLVIDIQKSSNQGGRKVGIVFEADRMNVQSANAFLKTLEEPPSGTTLFLLTSRPYDLLDTIRSRCLNFRIPAGIETIAHPDWPEWTKDYHTWLNSLIAGANKQTIPHIMLGSYGLNVRFQAILTEMTKTAWKAQKEELPEHVTSEEKDAMEAGMSRGYRKQLFGEIEKATIRFARSIEANNPGRLPVAALNRATQSLEHSAGLLEVNFNQSAALEMFFLKSMRIWASSAK